MKFQLSQQLPHKNVVQVLGLWKPNLVSDGSASEVTESTVVSPKPALDQLSSEPNERQPRQSPVAPPKDQWYSLTSERRYPEFTIPTRLKIGADIDEQINTWKDVIHEIIIWLVNTEKLTDNHLPSEIKGKLFISHEAVNHDGTPFKDPRPLPKGLILQRSVSTPLGQWEGFRVLLDQLNVDTSTIQVFYKPTGKASR